MRYLYPLAHLFHQLLIIFRFLKKCTKYLLHGNCCAGHEGCENKRRSPHPQRSNSIWLLCNCSNKLHCLKQTINSTMINLIMYTYAPSSCWSYKSHLLNMISTTLSRLLWRPFLLCFTTTLLGCFLYFFFLIAHILTGSILALCSCNIFALEGDWPHNLLSKLG